MGMQTILSPTHRCSTDKASHGELVYNGGVQNHSCDLFSNHLFWCTDPTGAVS
jgi:hypothetical protein